MDDKTQSAIDRTYAPIGKFVVTFEHLIDGIREIIVLTFLHHGLQRDSLVNVLLSGLTASPLLGVFESLIADAAMLDVRDQYIVTEIVKNCRELIQRRNQIIHGTLHWIDFARWPDESPEALVRTIRRTRRGHTEGWHTFTPNELTLLVEDVQKTKLLVRRLRSILAGDESQSQVDDD